ncbi:MAG: hypothetical protein LAT83_04975 [Kiritimatiellae bacterium]|nr:hypothetical protein [Kiritimatiellia bacterium]
MTYKRLWEAMTDEEREQASGDVWRARDPLTVKIRDQLMRALAEHHRFREKFIRNRPPEKKVELFLRASKADGMDDFLDDALRAWLITRHETLITTFLDATGLSRKGCFVADEEVAPKQKALQKGIRQVRKAFEERHVAFYLGFMLAEGPSVFWGELPDAISNEALDLDALLVSAGDDTKTETAMGSESKAVPLPETSERFTTLDQLLIKAVVASALEQEGAFPQDAVENLLEEVVDMSGDRQRSFFHRGFYHALFNIEPMSDFPGANVERRNWYFCGLLFGWLRHEKQSECLDLLKKHARQTDSLCRRDPNPCGAMLLPSMYPVLLRHEEFGLLKDWLESQLPVVRAEPMARLLGEMYQDASSFIRRGRPSEAMVLLQACLKCLGTQKTFQLQRQGQFHALLIRRIAQAHQLQGNFGAASKLLVEEIPQEEFDRIPGAFADLGLIEGGFRSLGATLPENREESIENRLESLRKGESRFRKAVEAHGDYAINAHFCLGLIHLLAGQEEAPEAFSHFSRALTGMLKQEDAYKEASVMEWARFGLGIALLETAEPSNLQSAKERIYQALEAGITFPGTLWARALAAAALFDDHELCSRVARELIDKRGDEAYPILQQAGIHRHSGLREPFLEWLDQKKWKSLELFHLFQELVGSDNSAEGIALDGDLLDRMEGLAIRDTAVRNSFLTFLRDGNFWEPAWSRMEAEECLVRLYEVGGHFQQAADLQRVVFFQLRDLGEDHHLEEARELANHIKAYHLSPDPSEELLACLPKAEKPEIQTSVEDLLKQGHQVSILYVGGNETQERYVDSLQHDFEEQFPGLEVTFYFPGWSSRWNLHLEKVKPIIHRVDGVVLNNLVRTQFGRHVRRECDGRHPWTPCTGRGRDSIRRSILRAATCHLGRLHDN